ncbi:hypothetical protein U9M48_044910 [Paspalum notatum var. saurae]|uniref:Uncharacterized protein n=1 Tax=Paspalum notatum var. saurae TaxID=547442 RepID=A0AAQ3UWM8_PASNO
MSISSPLRSLLAPLPPCKRAHIFMNNRKPLGPCVPGFPPAFALFNCSASDLSKRPKLAWAYWTTQLTIIATHNSKRDTS